MSDDLSKRIKALEDNHSIVKRVHLKNSFERFGDDLTEVVLSYFTFKERFRYECVSKQFKRCVFTKQIQVKDYVFYETDIKFLKPVLDKAPFTKKFFITAPPQFLEYTQNSPIKCQCSERQIFELIAEHCSRLCQLKFNFNHFSTICADLRHFLTRVGSRITRLEMPFGYIDHLIPNLLKYLPNLEILLNTHGYSGPLSISVFFDGNQLLVKNLQSINVCFRVEEIDLFGKLMDSNKNTLKSVSIANKNQFKANDSKKFFQHLLGVKNLITLRISCETYDHSFVMQFKQFSQKCPKLRDVYFSVFIDKPSIFSQFYQLIDGFEKLRGLNVTYHFFQIYEESSPTIIKLEGPPKQCPNLTDLSISGYFTIGDDFFKSVTQYLPRLQSISCANVDITQQTFKSLTKLKKLARIVFGSSSAKVEAEKEEEEEKKRWNEFEYLKIPTSMQQDSFLFELTQKCLDLQYFSFQSFYTHLELSAEALKVLREGGIPSDEQNIIYYFCRENPFSFE